MSEAVRALPRDRTIQGGFEEFHCDNPHIYEELVVRARHFKGRTGGWPGIGMLWEVVRWDMHIDTRTASVWKMNNNFRAHYARLIMACEPDMLGAFDIRQLRAA